MVNTKTIVEYHPSYSGGQGAVEAIVALPALLLLFSVLFQLFFIGMGQILLQYAVFCAARAGAVRGGDLDEMRAAADRILRVFPGNILAGRDSFELEILQTQADSEDRRSGNNATPIATDLLQLRISWDFPLTVPIVGQVIAGSRPVPRRGRKPSLSLSSSWSIPLQILPENLNNEGRPDV